jgi:hypothetical protein
MAYNLMFAMAFIQPVAGQAQEAFFRLSQSFAQISTLSSLPPSLQAKFAEQECSLDEKIVQRYSIQFFSIGRSYNYAIVPCDDPVTTMFTLQWDSSARQVVAVSLPAPACPHGLGLVRRGWHAFNRDSGKLFLQVGSNWCRHEGATRFVYSHQGDSRFVFEAIESARPGDPSVWSTRWIAPNWLASVNKEAVDPPK